MVSGIVWVNKRCLWLVYDCLGYHRPITTNACLPKRPWKSLHPKAWPTLQAKASEVDWRGSKSEIDFEDFKTSRTFLFSTFYFSYTCVECGKDVMSYFASSSSSSEVGNLYWRLTRPFSLLSPEKHKMNNGCWINSPSVSWRCLAKPKIMTKGQPDAHKKRKNHAITKPCYTVYIPVMKEYLKQANFLAFRILYRLSLATERERRLTTARANQTTGLTNGRGTNWTPEVKFSHFRALSRRC